jgi:hypothetical protein
LEFFLLSPKDEKRSISPHDLGEAQITKGQKPEGEGGEQGISSIVMGPHHSGNRYREQETAQDMEASLGDKETSIP